jgi:hypothetical protein
MLAGRVYTSDAKVEWTTLNERSTPILILMLPFSSFLSFAADLAKTPTEADATKKTTDEPATQGNSASK